MSELKFKIGDEVNVEPKYYEELKRSNIAHPYFKTTNYIGKIINVNNRKEDFKYKIKSDNYEGWWSEDKIVLAKEENEI